MRIKVLSDFHLGCKDKSDDFLLDEDTVINFLDNAIATYDKVVLAGDIFECWESTSFNDQQKRFAQILKNRPKISSYIISKIISEEIIYVSGNHDFIIKKKNLIPFTRSNYVLTTKCNNGKVAKIYIAHGHEADSFNSKISFIGKMIAWSIGWIERVGLRKEADIIKDMEKYIPGRNSGNDLFEEYALKKAVRDNYDVVVFGHTHSGKSRATVFMNSGIVNYGNSGCCCNSDFIESLDISIEDNRGIIAVMRCLDKGN